MTCYDAHMLPARILANVKKSRNGCWHWTGRLAANGYGQTSTGSRTDGTRRTTLAHRLAYEHAHGVELEPRGHPDHRQVDHECHNRSKSCKGGPSCLHRRCVNPAHLTLKTAAENTEDSSHTAAHKNRRKTHCGTCGNDLNGPDVYVYGRQRYCKPCCIRRRNESRRRQRA